MLALWRVAAWPQLSGDDLSLLVWGCTGWRKVAMEIVLNLDFLAGQNDPSPPDIAGTNIVFTDNIGVSCQDGNRPIRLVSQTVVQFVYGVGTLHPLIIA